MTGIETRKPYYWTYTRHMWRFYVRHGSDPPDTMTEPRRLDVAACGTVFRRMNRIEQDTIRFFAVVPWSTSIGIAVHDYSDRCGIREQTVWAMIERALRNAAIERGLI